MSSGTPLSWYNGNEYTLDWTNGTQLKSAKKGLALKTTYTYDMAGVRSGKTVGTTKYEFTTLSGLVMRQAWGARQMDFVYDENNQPYALIYTSGKNVTPVMYYYLLNQQGDVEALMDASGAIVATYEYDPWGAVTVKNASGALDNDDTSIGNLNPLRYRGYYYDNETGFYYLQSRYYDPVVGRFISADSFASTDITDSISANMFAYCNNDPVNYVDDGGSNPVAVALVNGVVSAGFTAASLAIDAKMNGKAINATSFAIAVVGSFVSGSLSAFENLNMLSNIISLGTSLVAGAANMDSWEDFGIDTIFDWAGTFTSFKISSAVFDTLKSFGRIIANLMSSIASFNFDSVFNSLKVVVNSLKGTSKRPTSRQVNVPNIHALGAG